MNVDFDHVTVRRGGNVLVDDVSFTAKSGEVVGLLGANGSGKSTLLRTAYRAMRPDSGSIRIGDTNVHRVSAKQSAQLVSVMLQDPVLDFDLTVEETVRLGRTPYRSSLGRDSAADVDIVERAMAHADVSEMRDRMVTSLSGGQRQRVMLARALAQQTPVMVLDEPSNHLDIAHQLDLMNIVRGLGSTVVVAVHDLNLATTFCDSVVVLDGGRMVASGPPATVLTPELMRSVFRVEARVVADSGGAVLAFRPLEGITERTELTHERQEIPQPHRSDRGGRRRTAADGMWHGGNFRRWAGVHGNLGHDR